jgi:hypothetical protein
LEEHEKESCNEECPKILSQTIRFTNYFTVIHKCLIVITVLSITVKVRLNGKVINLDHNYYYQNNHNYFLCCYKLWRPKCIDKCSFKCDIYQIS